VVVGFAAVFVLQGAVAQDAQLAAPQASELEREPERDVPQAAQPAAQVALPVPVGALVAHSVGSPGDPLDAQLALAELLAVHSASSVADLRDGPQDDCLAAHC
jgi:hypothetical protein